MSGFLLRRTLGAIVVMWAVATLVFGSLAGFRALGQKTAPLLRNE